MIPVVKLVRVLIGIGVLVLILTNYNRIRRIPAYPMVVAGFGTIMAGWIFSVLEELIWPEPLNLVAHLFYTSSSVLLALWTWRIFGRKGGHRIEPARTD